MLNQNYIIVGAIFLTTVILVIIGYQIPETGFHGKVLWDWLKLAEGLAIPIAAVYFGAKLNHDQQIATDNQEETSLQAYIDKMSELLLDKHLRKSKSDDEIRIIARARTMLALSHTNSRRKRVILQFLQQSGLLFKNDPIVDISGANLANADLRGIYLNRANLKMTYLVGADMTDAYLFNADLRNVRLSNANLTNAKLTGTNLEGAMGITTEEIEKQTQYTKGAIMPDGKKISK